MILGANLIWVYQVFPFQVLWEEAHLLQTCLGAVDHFDYTVERAQIVSFCASPRLSKIFDLATKILLNRIIQPLICLFSVNVGRWFLQNLSQRFIFKCVEFSDLCICELKVSRPYKSFDLIMTVNTWIFHFTDKLALFQNSIIPRHVAVQSPTLFKTSALLSNESARRLPK